MVDDRMFSEVDRLLGEADKKQWRTIVKGKPGELSVNSLSRNLGISKPVVDEIIQALEQMKILRVLRPLATGARLVRGEPKILFAHPNLSFAICRKLGLEPEIGAVREELALFGFELRGYTTHTVKGYKKNPDYIIKKGPEETVVEISGPNKGSAQIQDIPNALVIREQQLMALLMTL
jgi:predicted AAA+ superfamily ATPase